MIEDIQELHQSIPWGEHSRPYYDARIAASLEFDKVLTRLFTAEQIADHDMFVEAKQDAELSFKLSLTDDEHDQYIQQMNSGDNPDDIPEDEVENVIDAVREHIESEVEAIPEYPLTLWRPKFVSATRQYDSQDGYTGRYVHTIKFFSGGDLIVHSNRLLRMGEDELELDINDLPDLSVGGIVLGLHKAIDCMKELYNMPVDELMDTLDLWEDGQ